MIRLVKKISMGYFVAEIIIKKGTIPAQLPHRKDMLIKHHFFAGFGHER
jgi:hypothetical protein